MFIRRVLGWCFVALAMIFIASTLKTQTNCCSQDKQTSRQVDKHTNRQTDKQTNRQTDKQTNIPHLNIVEWMDLWTDITHTKNNQLFILIQHHCNVTMASQKLNHNPRYHILTVWTGTTGGCVYTKGGN